MDQKNQKQDADKEYVAVDSMADNETIKKYKEEWLYLKKELAKAQAENDLSRIEKAEEEFEQFQKQLVSNITKSGKSRNFANDMSRAKDRIRKSIERSLKNIKKYDETTWKHFYNSLRPINSFYQSYVPDRDINWLTE